MSNETKSTVVSFGAEPEKEVKQELAVPEQKQMAEYKQTRDVEGEVGREDVRMPRLGIVGKSGELADKFKPGSFALKKEYELIGPLVVSAVFIKKFYREVVNFDDPHTENPRVFATAAEVRAANLRVGKPTSKAYEEEAAPQADILFFIERPAGLNPESPLSDEFSVTLPSGRVGTIAAFTAARTTYNTVANTLFTAVQQNKHVQEHGLPSQLWQLSATLEKFENVSWWQGKLVPNGRLSDEDVAVLRETVGL